MKSTILLSTALFLASAPSPDSKVISEISAGFLSLTDTHGLMASDTPLNERFGTSSSASTPALLMSAQARHSNTSGPAD